MFLSTMLQSGIEFVGLILVFILILSASYFTAKWVSKHSLGNNAAGNIKLIETFRIAPGECLQIVKAGKKYLIIGVTKEHIEMLTELSEEDLVLPEDESGQQFQFQEVLALIKKKQNESKSKQGKK